MKCRTPACHFFTTREMRAANTRGREGNVLSRRSKANRVFGSPANRAIYISAHGHKHNDYSSLCSMANKANTWRPSE